MLMPHSNKGLGNACIVFTSINVCLNIYIFSCGLCCFDPYSLLLPSEGLLIKELDNFLEKWPISWKSLITDYRHPPEWLLPCLSKQVFILPFCLAYICFLCFGFWGRGLEDIILHSCLVKGRFWWWLWLQLGFGFWFELRLWRFLWFLWFFWFLGFTYF